MYSPVQTAKNIKLGYAAARGTKVATPGGTLNIGFTKDAVAPVGKGASVGHAIGSHPKTAVGVAAGTAGLGVGGAKVATKPGSRTENKHPNVRGY